MKLTPGPLIAAHESTATEVFDDGEFAVVVYESRSGAVQRLEAAAAAVWLAIDGPLTIHQIADDLAITFGETPEIVSPVVNELVGRFWAAGLLDGSQPIQDPDNSSRLDFVLARPPDP